MSNTQVPFAETEPESAETAEDDVPAAPASPFMDRMAAFGHQVTTLIKKHPLSALGTAVVVGFIVGRLIRR